jgi:hypothetical protein
MATIKSTSTPHSPQTICRSRAARLARIFAQDLRDLAAAEKRIGRSAKRAVRL